MRARDMNAAPRSKLAFNSLFKIRPTTCRDTRTKIIGTNDTRCFGDMQINIEIYFVLT